MYGNVLLLLKITNETGNNRYSNFNNGSELQDGNEFFFYNCVKTTEISNNLFVGNADNYTNLEKILSCILLSRNEKSYRPVVIDDSHIPEEELQIPEFLGFSSMASQNTSVQESVDLLSKTLDFSEHKFIGNSFRK